MKTKLVLGLLLLCLVLGCAKPQEVILVTGEGRRASTQEIDEDAFRLLPPGAVVLVRVDAERMFASDFGKELGRLLTEMLPFAKGAGISPERDISVVVAAMYATGGMDMTFVCKGKFRGEATATSIKENPKTESGKAILTVSYAGATMYVAGEVAMAILTDQTMVFGSQLSVRRVLEGVQEGRLARHVPKWFESMLSRSSADFQIGVDLDAQPIPSTLGEQVELLKSVRAARLLGNFEEPGLNFAGTLSYRDPESAEEASKRIEGLTESLDRYGVLLAALQIPQPIVRLEAKPTGKETQVVAELRGDSVAELLKNASQLLGQEEGGGWLPN